MEGVEGAYMQGVQRGSAAHVAKGELVEGPGGGKCGMPPWKASLVSAWMRDSVTIAPMGRANIVSRKGVVLYIDSSFVMRRWMRDIVQEGGVG